ncbi:MAG: fimbrial assembly protein [Rubrivivax sp.]|nr:fimbrial assembly protein [Rubrivivax sp.]
MSRLNPSALPTRQRGVATLAIVSILFFIVALVAAYTNRNLIFEQRTSGNQWRATLAFEAAEGGVEWVLSQLNSGRIGDTCLPTDDVVAPSFRQRYLNTAAATGVITAVPNLSFSCVSDGAGGWTCSCPAAGNPAPAAPAGTGVYPAFRARFNTVAGTRAGVVDLEVNGCTRLDDQCLQFPALAVGNEGRATVRLMLALRNGLAAAPIAAVTARGNILYAGSLGAYNPQPVDGGFAILAGGAVDEDPADPGHVLRVGSAPGTPLDVATVVVQGDLPLQAVPDGRRMFAATFAVWPEDFHDQPGAVVLDCSAGCNGDDIRGTIALNPGRVLWAEGDVTLDGGAGIGSAAAPVVIIVAGDVSIETDVFGLVYLQQPVPLEEDVTEAGALRLATGNGTLTGALVVEGSLGGATDFSVVRDRAVLEAAQRTVGSFVRVPMSWRDF